MNSIRGLERWRDNGMYKFTTTELCSMNGYPITDYDKIGVEDKKQIQQIRNKEIYEINKK